MDRNLQTHRDRCFLVAFKDAADDLRFSLRKTEQRRDRFPLWFGEYRTRSNDRFAVGFGWVHIFALRLTQPRTELELYSGGPIDE